MANNPMAEKLEIPRLSLVFMVGPTGSGKSTFAAKHFTDTEIISSDRLRALIDDDENSQWATNDAFDILRQLVDKRLARGRLTVVDATNVNIEDRRPLLKLAQKHHAAPVAIVLNVDKEVCHQRNAARSDRGRMNRRVVERHAAALKKTIESIRREGFYRVFALSDPAAIEAAEVVRERMRADKCDEHGPFDIIGDVHGCHDELLALLERLGYAPDDEGVWRSAKKRRAVFLGDLINRGPRSIDTLRLVMRMCAAGEAFCLPGNHEGLFLKWITGTTFTPTHGLRQTLNEIDAMPAGEWPMLKSELASFLRGLESHLIFDDGSLVVAHAGMTAELAGRVGVRHFALYGETRGEIDGYSRRRIPLWAMRYRARARVIYGHAAVVEPKRAHNTLNIDTGCVFGGNLTALRYPEGELVSVPAARAYFEPDPQFAKPTAEAEDEAAKRESAEAGQTQGEAAQALGEPPQPQGEPAQPQGEPAHPTEALVEGSTAEAAAEGQTVETPAEATAQEAALVSEPENAAG